MSYREFLDWIKYRNRWGPLHLGMRIDRAVARPSAVFAGMYSKGKITFEDFSPYDVERTKQANSPQEVFEYLKGIAKHGK